MISLDDFSIVNAFEIILGNDIFSTINGSYYRIFKEYTCPKIDKNPNFFLNEISFYQKWSTLPIIKEPLFYRIDNNFFLQTWFTRSVDMCSRFIVDPIEAGFDGQSCQKAIFPAVSIRGREVNCTSFVVKGLVGMMSILIPSLSDSKFYSWPLIHHRDGKRIELFFTTLKKKKKSYYPISIPAHSFHCYTSTK